MQRQRVRSLLLGSLVVAAAGLPAAVAAQEAEEPVRERVFTLGEIVVIGTREGGIASAGASVITEVDTRKFERRTLDQAVNLAPGVVGGYSGNSRRNEPNIYVRGQDRWRVPLLIDGVRYYLPADNRIDFARFLTTNLSAIQIQKGYASVLDGPGAMGGAVNIVTRRPTRSFESEAGFSLGGRSDLEEWSGYLTAGTLHERFYALGSFSYADRDSWSLSGKYEPRHLKANGTIVPSDSSLQAAGARLGSDARDWNLNLKFGFTPNETDEYAISFLRQEGEKSGLLDVYNNPTPMPNSFWKWPEWNVQTLSFLSSTQIGDASALKVKLFYNTFDNALYMYDDITYRAQTATFTQRSLYDDHTYGAVIEMGTRLFDSNTFKTAFHYRDDTHTEAAHLRPEANNAFQEPSQTQGHVTWSLAAENTFHVAPSVDLVAGVSYETYEVSKSEEFNTTAGIFERAKGGADTFNWQAAAIWRQSATRQLHASVSSRTRFPGLWELYSTRFGAATPNPDLGPERATNMEVGWTEQVGGDSRVSLAVFYNRLADLIQSVPLTDGSNTVQPQNVGDGRFYGFELSADARLASALQVGGHYSYINREIVDEILIAQREAAGQAPLQLTEVPPHSAFVYATWSPIGRLDITPSVEFASDRWSDVTVRNNPPNPLANTQVETGAYTLLNVSADYAVSERASVTVGARNLLDANYELVWGLPQPGRNLYVKMRMGM